MTNMTETLGANTGVSELLPGEFEAVHYYPDGTYESTSTVVSQTELAAMGMALSWADEAMATDNPPIGAVLLSLPEDPQKQAKKGEWGAPTSDISDKTINNHAEPKAWARAKDVVGRDLSECTLVTTAALCSSCAPLFAEGKIDRVIFAASRREAWDASGGHLMRPRKRNMHDLFEDGETDTLVVGGIEREAALAKYALWAIQHGYKNAPPTRKIPLLSLVDELTVTKSRAIDLRTHIPDKDSNPNH